MESFIRNVKFYGLQYTSEFEEMLRLTNSLLNDLSNHIRSELLSGKMLDIHSMGKEQYVTMDYSKSKEEALTRARYRDTVQFILDKYPIKEKRKSLERNLVGYVLERFAGYYKRNSKDKVPTITFKNKDIKYKDRSVVLDTKKKTLKFPTVFGDYTLNYTQNVKGDRVKSEKYAGNLVIKKKEFVIAINVPFVAQYTPETVLGFDLNKSLNNWLVFNTGDIITGDETVYKYIDEIRKLNKIIDNNNKGDLKSSQRSAFRRQVQNKHRKFNKEISKVCNKIIDVVKDRKALLCIDMVKTGQKMGTFGQDKIIPQLQTMCENQGVPFIAVPCRNTSRRCSSCGYVHKDNRKTVDEFKCLKCQHEDISHFNAAKNIAFLGNKMFEGGVPCGNHGRISVEKLIEKHGSHQHPKQHVMTFMTGS